VIFSRHSIDRGAILRNITVGAPLHRIPWFWLHSEIAMNYTQPAQEWQEFQDRNNEVRLVISRQRLSGPRCHLSKPLVIAEPENDMNTMNIQFLTNPCCHGACSGSNALPSNLPVIFYQACMSALSIRPFLRHQWHDLIWL